MDLDSLASVVLWAIVLILMFGLQPWKTMNGMRNAMEHRPDRYSASLHIIDMDDGMHFGDRTPTTAGKGTAMQSGAQATKLDDKRIEHVRALRRAAIRRRQILVGSLLAVAVVVFVLALLLHFSPLFALIPVVLDVIVLALGVRASKQAREWEHKVAAAKRRAAKKKSASAKEARNRGAGAAAAAAASGEPETQTATDAMSAQDIQAALERAKAEKIAALRARELERRAREAAARAQAQSVMPDDDEGAVEETPAAAAPSSSVPAAQAAQSPATIAPRSQRRHETGETPKAARQQTGATGARPAAQQSSHQATVPVAGSSKPVAAKPTIKEKPAAEPEDFTNELERVSPSHALDAFELASNQDLISFSLGAPRHGKPVKAAEPQSLEIKSTKQVAHAEPVKAKTPSDAKPAAAGSDKDGMASRSDTKASAEESRPGRPAQAASARPQRADARPAANAVSKQTAPVTPSSIRPASVPKDDAVSRLVGDKKVEEAAARRAERKAAVAAHAPVAAPKETEESLGVNVDAVLARRRG